MIRTLKQKEIIKIIESNYIGNLSYIYRGRPFIAPITYYYDAENHSIVGYSAEGHKISAMRKNENVAMIVSEIDSVNHWESALVQGKFKELSGCDAKAELHKFSLGVKELIIDKEHRKLDFINEFSSNIQKDDIPIVFKIEIEEISGRIRRY